MRARRALENACVTQRRGVLRNGSASGYRSKSCEFASRCRHVHGCAIQRLVKSNVFLRVLFWIPAVNSKYLDQKKLRRMTDGYIERLYDHTR